MKKLLLVLLLVSGSFVKAYDLQVRNNTGHTLDVEATYGGAGVCSTDNFRIKPGKTFSKGTGACCLNMLIVKVPGMSGERRVQGKLTGYGISCRSNKFVVNKVDAAGGKEGFPTVEQE